jgi:Transglutaminase-like superfamily
MPKPRRKPTPSKRSTAKPPRPHRFWLNVTLLTVTLGILGALAVLSSTPETPTPAPATLRPVVPALASPIIRRPDALSPKTLAELLALPPEQLERVDIGLMNLLCATGLPGSETLDIPAALATLDGWALKVKYQTDRHMYRLTDARYADHYRRSETYFRASWLLQTLQEECGVRYNHDRIYSPDFSDSRDQFIHGLMDPKQGGTCASMPVLYTVVGRRLGYPIKLVQARGHLFCRWDDGKGETLNIEGSGEGFSAYPDDFYRQWPYPLTDADMASREYLVSLTPAEELAVFMAARGHCYMDLHRFGEALDAYKVMARLAPTFRVHGDFVNAAQLAADKGLAEYERVYGRMPERMDPPPVPPEFANTPGG